MHGATSASRAQSVQSIDVDGFCLNYIVGRPTALHTVGVLTACDVGFTCDSVLL